MSFVWPDIGVSFVRFWYPWPNVIAITYSLPFFLCLTRRYPSLHLISFLWPDMLLPICYHFSFDLISSILLQISFNRPDTLQHDFLRPGWYPLSGLVLSQWWLLAHFTNSIQFIYRSNNSSLTAFVGFLIHWRIHCRYVIFYCLQETCIQVSVSLKLNSISVHSHD